MNQLSQSNLSQSNSLYQIQNNNAPKKLQKSQYYRYSENYYRKTLGEAENQTNKSDFQEKASKLKRTPLIFLYENTVRNFGRLCDRYFGEYSKYHHNQLYGTNKNYEIHKAQMFNQFNVETSGTLVARNETEPGIGAETEAFPIKNVTEESIQKIDQRTFYKCVADHMVITFKSFQINISESRKDTVKKVFSSLVNFTNLKKLISNNTTLEIISKIKSGIKYDKETNIITFQIDEETNNNIKHQKKKSNIENEIFPDITHSHIKVNDSLELLAEIKFPCIEFYLNAYAYSQTHVLRNFEIEDLLRNNFTNAQEFYKQYFQEDEFLKVTTNVTREKEKNSQEDEIFYKVQIEKYSMKQISDSFEITIGTMKTKYQSLEDYYNRKIIKEVVIDKDRYLTIAFHAHLLTVIRKITIEDDLEEIIEGSPGQINSPTKKNQERNKRFLTLNEFNRLVFLTKNNDISEIIKDHVKLDENKMDLVVESNYKKSVKSRIDLVLPTQTNVNEFYEISKENLENNLLTYREIIIGNTLLKIEPPTITIYNPTSKEIWKEPVTLKLLNEFLAKKFLFSLKIKSKN